MARREFLSRTAKNGAALLAVKALSKLEAGQPFTPFQHGVASGDPQQDRVIIWTRITPSPEATPGATLGAPTRVEWKVAADAGFRTVVRAGTATSAPTSDHTIKIDVVGLLPGQTYSPR
jgi:alkaline phosphatase D